MLTHTFFTLCSEYCTNRIHRLRQILKLTQANNKQTNLRKSLPTEFSDVRYLHLYVYDCERAWAFAMELKQESANSMDTRQRHHLVKRLKRAAQHAQTLYTLCQNQTVESRTVLDAKVIGIVQERVNLSENSKRNFLVIGLCFIIEGLPLI